jgi:DNA polymerase III delta prime subunit
VELTLSTGSFFGQSHALGLLRAWQVHEHVPTSVLFSGPPMLGKTTLALIYARSLLCIGKKSDIELTACGECFPCKAILTGNFSDFTFVLPRTKEITVETVRDDYDNFSFAVYHPSHSKRRVILIDSAHTLNEQSGNMMLKLFEEAPNATVFILVTDHPYDLLPTVKSRCEEIKFNEEPIARIETELRARHFDASMAKRAASLSQGKWVLANILVKDSELIKLIEITENEFYTVLAKGYSGIFESVLEEASKKLAGYLVLREKQLVEWTLPDKELLGKKDKKVDERYEVSQTRRNELERVAWRTMFDTLRNHLSKLSAENRAVLKKLPKVSDLLERADTWLMQNVTDDYILSALREGLSRQI